MSANHELNLFEGGEKEKITDLLPYQKEDRLFFFYESRSCDNRKKKSSYLNIFDSSMNKSLMQGLHAGNETRNPLFITSKQDFIANSDEFNPCLRIIWLDIVCNPLAGGIYIDESRNITITYSDSHGDVRIGKSAKNIRIGVKDFDAIDSCLCFEEASHLRW